MSKRAVFIGGPVNGYRGELMHLPDQVAIGQPGSKETAIYERVDDPDTGDYLGGYAWVDPDAAVRILDRPGGLIIGKAKS